MYNFDIYIFEKLSLFLNILFPVIRREKEKERGKDLESR